MKKGFAHPTTVSPSSYITPYTPLKSDAEEANKTLKTGEIVKVQLGAQIDGFGTIICDNFPVGGKATGREADLLLATHYANELLLRLLVPPGLTAANEEDKKEQEKEKQATQAKINLLVEKVAKAYDCNVVESTTTWLFDRNEIEGKKKIILNAAEGVKGEGIPDVGEVWGVEIGLSLGSGKVKTLSDRPTLHRRTTTTYGLKRDSSKKTLTEVVKKFGTFPFSLRQLEDERNGKVGIVECVRGGVVKQYEVVVDKDNEPVSRLFTTIGEYFYPEFLLVIISSCLSCSSVRRSSRTFGELWLSSCFSLGSCPKHWNLISVWTFKKDLNISHELFRAYRCCATFTENVDLDVLCSSWAMDMQCCVSMLTCITAITKKGLIRLAEPPSFDVSKYQSDKKITDEEVLKILERPLSKEPKKKKK